METNKIIQGDASEVLKSFPENTFDSVVTDPPYELGFMHKEWDKKGIAFNVNLWKEVLRVLKPGGHLLSFGGTRTYHRMACAIEDAGFEIRDMIEWCYSQGFPKGLNIGKQVDKIKSEIGRKKKFVEWFRTTGLKRKELNKILGTSDIASHYFRLDQPAIPTLEFWQKIKPLIKIEIPEWIEKLVQREEAEREIIGKSKAGFLEKNNVFELNNEGYGTYDVTKGNSEWEGWGTALKPAHEPIVVARKPIEKGLNVAENMLKWGTGGLNIEESRVSFIDEKDKENARKLLEQFNGKRFCDTTKIYELSRWNGVRIGDVNEFGRFPANLILSYNEDKYILKDNLSKEQIKKVYKWLYENA